MRTSPALKAITVINFRRSSSSSFLHTCRLGRERLLFSNNFEALFARRTTPFRLPQARFRSSFHSNSFMEVFKAAYKKGSMARDSVAIRADQKSYSYDQLASSALRISSLLCSNDLKTTSEKTKNENSAVLAGGCGARIGIVAKPSFEFVAGVLGTWFSGCIAVPLALSYPESELLHVMHDSDISMVLSTEDYREVLQNVASKSGAKFSLIPPVPNVSSETTVFDQSQAEKMDGQRGEDPALIVYTSGTTGKPKGVVHTHKSIDAQVEFMPKFSVRGIWQRWRESYPVNGNRAGEAITAFTGVPTMYTRLIQGYEAMDTELQAASASAAKQLRLMMCGSSALPLPVMQQWETITGHRLLERYGMTEFVMAISNPLRGARKAGTVGNPLPGVQVKIAEDESGSDAAGVGEICVKSPSLFKEYWKLPKVTKDSFTADGFFKTGDTGKQDEDGYYIILGRTSADIMKVGGYKLSALEIESVLLEHPAVAECCVLGLPDKDYGDAVSAIIVLEEEAKRDQEKSKPVLSLQELCTWAKDKLAPYKLPTRLFLWDSLPRNAMGKAARLLKGWHNQDRRGDWIIPRDLVDLLLLNLVRESGGHSCLRDSDEARIRAKRKKFWEKAVDIEERCGVGETGWGVKEEMRGNFNHSNKPISYAEHFRNSQFVESILDVYRELPPVSGPSLTHQTRFDPARVCSPILEDGRNGLFQRLRLARLETSVFNGYTQMVYLQISEQVS
ncbi:Malonate--CoA ligase [Citrus sinensis]|uniref:Malonate--CoA ligase n=2 Tax=Citrus sinensis TaxID=2711 RepID=A0ACB8J9C7_CITSI|nr:Malonate--CoA ligase [Citrus sinensis]